MTTVEDVEHDQNGVGPVPVRHRPSELPQSGVAVALTQVHDALVGVATRMADTDDQVAQTQTHAMALQAMLERLVGDVDTALRQVDQRLRRLELDAAGRDIDAEAQRQAVAGTARFVDEHLREAQHFRDKAALLDWAVDIAPAVGLVLEFGVATGSTLRQIVARRGRSHGFDSFEGLPEDWRPGFGTGRFAQAVPDVPGAELHIGLFSDTLPAFLAAHPEPWAFVHLDADLYSSTRTVLELARDRIVPGTVLLFDEYFNYPGWEHHEHKALAEFVLSGRRVRYLAYNGADEQVAVQVL